LVISQLALEVLNANANMENLDIIGLSAEYGSDCSGADSPKTALNAWAGALRREDSGFWFLNFSR
jgi:hypothetical protein